MAIPSVNMLSNLPGGALPNVLDAHNTFAKNRADRRYSEAKANYAPLTMQAQAASQLAYAKLMGPQYVAKLLQNDGILANLPDAEKKALLGMVTNAGVSATQGGNALGQMPQQDPQHTGIGQPSTNNFAGFLKNAFKGLIGQGQTQNQPINPFAQSAQAMQPMPKNQNALTMPQGNPPMNATPGKRPKDGVTVEGQQWYNAKGEPVYAEEEQVNEPGDNAMELKLTEGQRGKKEPTWEENTGKFKGVVREGEELGKIRAASVKELDQDYQQALQLKQPIDLLGKIITNPKFQNLRNLPGFQKLQMNGKATFGTPEEKKLIGEFQAAARQVVSATVKGFGGRILASEIPLSESMKLSDNDSIEAMLGKEPVIKAFNEMTLQRSRIASKLMKDYHLDKGDALEQADKMVDGEAIRKKVDQELNPISDEDIEETAKANGMTREQVIQRLKKEGRYNG
jgi:hypothetical protein